MGQPLQLERGISSADQPLPAWQGPSHPLTTVLPRTRHGHRMDTQVTLLPDPPHLPEPSHHLSASKTRLGSQIQSGLPRTQAY